MASLLSPSHLISDVHAVILSSNIDVDFSFMLLLIVWVCIVFLFIFGARAKVVSVQVIDLTEELLATAKQNEISGSNTGSSGRMSPGMPQSGDNQMVHP